MARTLRLGITALVMLCGAAATSFGALALLGPGVLLGDAVFLACSLLLLGSAEYALRNAVRGGRFAQLAAAAALLALFFTGYARHRAGATVTTHAGTGFFDPTLTLACLLFVALILSHYVRRTGNAHACNCGR